MGNKKSLEGATLLKSFGFWCSLLAPIAVGLFLNLTLIPEDGWGFNWSIDGFENWYTYYKVPLLIMGLSGPIVAIYIAHHRSVHQDMLFQTQGYQNRRNNYIETLKEFSENYSVFLKRSVNVEIVDRYPAARDLFGMIWLRDEDYDLSKLSIIAHNLNDLAIEIKDSMIDLDKNFEEVEGDLSKIDKEIIDRSNSSLIQYILFVLSEENGLGFKMPEGKVMVSTFLYYTYVYHQWIAKEISYISGYAYSNFLDNEAQLKSVISILGLNVHLDQLVSRN